MSQNSQQHALSPKPSIGLDGLLIPRDPIVARAPFFYGWVMLPIAIAAQIATSPGQTYAISAFNTVFRADLGLSHTQLTGAYMLGTLMAALPVSFVGVLMDRFGIRRSMTVVVILFGATCVAVSQVTGLFTLFLAFFMLRMLGQGALSLLSSNTLAMWFHTRLGTASGIMSAGAAMAFAVVPAMNLFLIDLIGWRWTYALSGCAVWLVMLPLLAVFYRNRPEDVGQLPDGVKKVGSAADTEKTIASHAMVSMNLSQALHTRAYWILMMIHIIWSLVGTAIVFSVTPLLESRGLSSAETALFFTFFAFSLGTMQFVGGLLTDRYRLNLLLCIALLGMTLSLAYLTQVETRTAVCLFAIALGLSQGLFSVLGQTIWARYYGREHLGKIRGVIWTACVAGSSMGPFVMGVAKDTLGVYTPVLWLFMSFYACLSVAALFATPPKAVAAPSTGSQSAV